MRSAFSSRSDLMPVRKIQSTLSMAFRSGLLEYLSLTAKKPL